MSIEFTLTTLSSTYIFCACAFNLIVGIIGNLLRILIFTNLKLFRDNQCSFYFVSESVSNIGFLIAIYSSQIYRGITGQDPNLIHLYWCKIRAGCSEIFGFCSLFAICWSTFDQYLSTNHRYTLRRWSSLKLAHRLISSTVFFIILHNILLFIFLETASTKGCSLYQPIIRRYYSFFYYPILSTAVPLVTTVGFSVLAYRNVRRIVRRQMPIVRRRLDRQMTAFVLARVVCLVVCGLPYILITLYHLNVNPDPNDSLTLAIVTLLDAIVYSLLYFNFAVSGLFVSIALFVIFVYFSD